MEKVFQIHLAGMLFTIEEQAYHQLKLYLDNLHTHFASNPEVVQDIESRMAELFSRRLDQSRSTLFINDVTEVIAIMGNIHQMDDQEAGQKENKEKAPDSGNLHQKKLRRNTADQSLGGVCSGIASFFDVDPVIVRVLFVVLLIIYGSGILLYLLLWMVVPEAKNEEAEYMRLQRQNKTKRLFRDADNRVVGGVSAGLSNYFGIDRIWIRLIFLLSVFLFGTGFWLYIVLWIIVPKAITASDKLLMRGETADIRSIEREVLQNQGSNRIDNFARHGSNLMGKIIKGMLKLFGGLIAFILFSVIIAISIALIAVFFNLGETQIINELIDFTIRDRSIIIAAKTGVMLCILVPCIGLLLIVINALFHTKFITRNLLLSLGVFFAAGVICLAYAGVNFISGVHHTESNTKSFKLLAPDTLYLGGIEMPFSNEENEIQNDFEIAFQDKGILIGRDSCFLELDDVKIKQSKSDSIILKIVKRANGRNKGDANNKIEMITFNPKIEGNRITIPSYFSLSKNKQFSWQEVDVTLWIPEDKVIIIDEKVKEILNDQNLDEADGEIYKFNKGILKCMDCGEDFDEEADISDENENIDIKMKINDKQFKVSTEDADSENENKKIIHRKGEEITVEETHTGPITIKVTKKKNK